MSLAAALKQLAHAVSFEHYLRDVAVTQRMGHDILDSGYVRPTAAPGFLLLESRRQSSEAAYTGARGPSDLRLVPPPACDRRFRVLRRQALRPQACGGQLAEKVFLSPTTRVCRSSASPARGASPCGLLRLRMPTASRCRGERSPSAAPGSRWHRPVTSFEQDTTRQRSADAKFAGRVRPTSCSPNAGEAPSQPRVRERTAMSSSIFCS